MTHTRKKNQTALAALALVGGLSSLNAASILADIAPRDSVIQGNFENGNPDRFLTNDSNARRVGTGGGGGDQRVNQPVLGFLLPTIPAGETLGSAFFGFTMDTTAINGAPIGFDMVISLMNQTDVSGFSVADFTEDGSALGNGTFVATVAAGDVRNNRVEEFELPAAALAQLAGLYDAAGNPSQTEVFFRLSTSAAVVITNGANDNDRFNLARSGTPNQVVRTLRLETIPEPSSSALILLALGAGFARRRRA